MKLDFNQIFGIMMFGGVHDEAADNFPGESGGRHCDGARSGESLPAHAEPSSRNEQALPTRCTRKGLVLELLLVQAVPHPQRVSCEKEEGALSRVRPLPLTAAYVATSGRECCDGVRAECLPLFLEFRPPLLRSVGRDEYMQSSHGGGR